MSNLPVNYEEELAKRAQAAAGVERQSVSSVGTRAGVLTLGGNPVAGNRLDCVIIASTHANLYYEGAFDPTNLTNPACYAYSPDGEGMAPHPKSSAPQAPSCDECPHNKWGSRGKGKACKNVRHLALVPADVTEDTAMSCEISVLRLPVMSVKNWADYVNKLSLLFKRPPEAMVTQVGSVPDPKSQFKITFNQVRELEQATVIKLMERQEYVKSLIEREYEPNGDTNEEPVKQKKKF